MIRGTEVTDRTVRRPPRRRWVVVLLTFLAMAAFAWPSASRWLRTEHSVSAAHLRFADVTRGDLERDVPLNGRSVAAFHPRVFSSASGNVRLVAVPGQTVTQGEVLARVESPQLTSRLAQERSLAQGLASELERRRIAGRTLTIANSQRQERLLIEAEAAERGMARAQRIFDEGLTNTIEYESAQDQQRLTRLALAHARQESVLDGERQGFELRQAELDLERQQLVTRELERQVAELEVRTPVDGLVTSFEVEDHDSVAPGQRLVSVVDLSSFEIEVGVPQSHAAEVLPGTTAEITLKGQKFPGRVRQMSPEVEGNVVTTRVAFDGEIPPGLKQNQTVSVRLVLEARHDVLRVRRGPFLEAGGGRRAYVVGNDGLAHRREITVGVRSVAWVEILSGLQAHETVIISDTVSFDGAETVLVQR
jgi:HlyD family secretion protein